MKPFNWIILALTGLVLAGGVAAGALLPGPQHMLCPACHGLEEIAPRTFVEDVIDPTERQGLLRMLQRARAPVVAFYGELRSTPTIVMCQTKKCALLFGSEGAKGVTYGWHAILLSPSRIQGVIASHELAHAELHWRMGLLGWARGTVPAWFDEGLAVIISDDPRFKRDTDAPAVRDIMQVKSYLGAWSAHARRVGWRTAYGAAATRVRQLQRRIGRQGLQRIVKTLVRKGGLRGLLDRVEAGDPL